MIRFVDAHNHLQRACLGAQAAERFASIGVVGCVVNGTSPRDWGAVTELSNQYDWITPAYGVHPWYLKDLSADWFEQLESLLKSEKGVVGEIGIDHAIKDSDRAFQEEVFVRQLKLAIELNLPVSIHATKAWSRLLTILREQGAPQVGFLLHSYSGPLDLIPKFIELGGYFSCAPRQLDPHKAKSFALFQSVPIARLLPETDASDANDLRGGPIDHSAALVSLYTRLFELVKHNVNSMLTSIEELAHQFEANFKRLFSTQRYG